MENKSLLELDLGLILHRLAMPHPADALSGCKLGPLLLCADDRLELLRLRGALRNALLRDR